MTSYRGRPKPQRLELTYARAELLTMALFEQRLSLRRTLRMMEANPRQTPQEKAEIEETRSQFVLCGELQAEVAKMELVLKE